MKKFFGCLFIFSLLAGIAMAASVTVTNPAAGETVVKGQPYTIIWTKIGDMPPGVKITLRDQNSTTDVLQIADPAQNSGSYLWTVPASFPDGSYRIRVKVKTVPVFDDSDIFLIAASAPPPPPTPTITVTKPAANETWHRNTAYIITWTKKGTMPNSVKIDLMDKNSAAVVKPIADNQLNNESYQWTVPGDFAFGDYRVRVQVKTTSIQDDSDTFHIGLTQIPGAKVLTKMLTIKTHVVPAINVWNPSCWSGSPIVGISPCAVWSNVMSIFQARPVCAMQGPDTAMVGADHFTYIWENGPAPITAYKAYRSRLGFDVSAFMGKGGDITEAKLHMTQLSSVRSNTSDASCGVSWWFLTADPVNSGQGWQDVPVDSSCHGSLNYWESEYSVDVSCAVQRWVSGSYPNHGIILISRWESITSEVWTCISCFKTELVIKIKE